MWLCIQAGHLRRHMKMHSRENSNKCNQCDFASSRAGNLRTHMLYQNPEKYRYFIFKNPGIGIWVWSRYTGIFRYTAGACSLVVSSLNGLFWCSRLFPQKLHFWNQMLLLGGCHFCFQCAFECIPSAWLGLPPFPGRRHDPSVMIQNYSHASPAPPDALVKTSNSTVLKEGSI